MRKLASIQLRVESPLFQQLLMGPLLHDMAIPHDQDHIRFPDGRKTMGYDEGGPALHHGIKGFLYADFRSGINGRGRFIQEQHRGQTQHHPGDAQKAASDPGTGFLRLQKSPCHSPEAIAG